MKNLVTSDKIHLPRSARRTGDTTFDRIYKFHFVSDAQIELSDTEERIRERWDFAWKHLGGFLNRSKIVKRLMAAFNISQSQAFEDIKNAERLFGDPTHQNKAAKKAIISDAIERALRKAEKDKNWKVFDRLLLRYRQFNDLDKEEDDKFIEYIKKKRPATIVFVTDPEVLKKQTEELMADVEDVDFDDLTEEAPEDADQQQEHEK